MPPLLLAQLKSIGRSINAFTLGQKVIAVIGVAVLALGGTALYTWASKPDYTVLYSNLAGADASAITDQLTADGVKYQLSNNGATIMVPADVADAERVKAAGAGLPNSSATGYALLDKGSVTDSQFQQKVTYQRALEGELVKTIQSIQGVDVAVVHIAVPEQTVFTDKAGTPTASVVVGTRSGAALTDDQVQAIVHLVSSSVPNMSADQVTVSNDKGQLLAAAGTGTTGGSSDAQTTAYDTSTAAAIQAMLDRVLGAGNAIASVNADLDYDKTQETSETFSSTNGTPPLSSTTSKETYAGGSGNTAAGTLGLDTNGNASSGSTASGSGGYTKESGTSDNAVNKVTKQTVAAPGSVKRQSVAVVVDSAAAAKAGIPQLTSMISAAAGIDPSRNDTLSVTEAPFDQSLAKAAKTQLAQQKSEEAAAAKKTLITQGSIAGAVLLFVVVFALMWRRAAKRVVREPVDIGELNRLYPASGPVITPDGSMALTAVSSDLVPSGPDPAALRRAEVGDLVDTQPGEVADLLRGWLAETKKG